MAHLFMNSKSVMLKVYKDVKYCSSKENLTNCKTVTYDDCTGYEVVSGKEAEEIEAHTDGSCIDDLHDYLVLYLEGGETATFRNSYVDLFVMDWKKVENQ